jgi:hypothetical protein
MVRAIISVKDKDVIREIKKHARVIYQYDLINAVGVEIPERGPDNIRKLKGVEKVDISGKLDILA